MDFFKAIIPVCVGHVTSIIKIGKIIHCFQLRKVFLDLFRGADREPRARNAGPEASLHKGT